MAELPKTLRDAAYVAIGAGVIGFQKAQVRRHELTRQLYDQRPQIEAQLEEARGQLTELVKSLDVHLQPVVHEIEGRLDVFEERLPPQAKDLVSRARSLAKDAGEQVRRLVGAP